MMNYTIGKIFWQDGKTYVTLESNQTVRLYSQGRQHTSYYVRLNGKKFVAYLSSKDDTVEIDMDLVHC